MNFIHVFWPSLLKIEGFLQSMATPINRAWLKTDKKKKKQKIFYTLADCEKWKKEIGKNISKWELKYYKGLGTSSEEEAQEVFEEFEKRMGRVIAVSATPAAYELEKSGGAFVEQVIRPTGLIDPEIDVRPIATQIDDLIGEVKKRAARN